MEYLIVGIVVLPDQTSPEALAKFEAKLVEQIKLDELDIGYTSSVGREPLVYWAFHPLNVPFPIDWRKN